MMSTLPKHVQSFVGKDQLLKVAFKKIPMTKFLTSKFKMHHITSLRQVQSIPCYRYVSSD